jgi:hypothetical protein
MNLGTSKPALRLTRLQSGWQKILVALVLHGCWSVNLSDELHAQLSEYCFDVPVEK